MFGSEALHRVQFPACTFIRYGGRPMYFVAVVLIILSAVFYAAGLHEMGSYSADVCRYGGTFFDNPAWVLTGAGLAAAWGKFVSIR